MAFPTSMNPVQPFMSLPTASADWLKSSVAPMTAADMSPIAMPDLGGLMNITSGPQAPGLMDSLKSAFSNQPWFSSVDPKTGMKNQGLFDMGLGAAQTGLGAYLGFQNLGIARDTLAQNKRAFDLNFNAQRNLTNSRLQDRQAGRVAFDSSQTPVAAYMKQNGI